MTLRLHLEKEPNLAKYVDTVYVDNFITNHLTEKEAISVTNELTSYLQTAQLQLTQFVSNNEAVHYSLTKEPQPEEISVLWIKYLPRRDVIRIAVSQKEFTTLTKRQLVSRIAEQFDPLGLLTPLMLTPKQFIQRAWAETESWDTRLPQELVKEWNQKEKIWTGEHIIPRHLHDTTTCYVHIFQTPQQRRLQL